jgi:predicted RND superfamily exporter protein
METIRKATARQCVRHEWHCFLTFLMFRGALSTILALVPLLVGSVWTLGMMVLFESSSIWLTSSSYP